MSGSDARALSRSLLDLCRMRKLTVATAESCTGGAIAARLVGIEGASQYFLGSLVTYSNRWKEQFLQVSPDTLAETGSVSEGVAREMAAGLLARSDADYVLAITGQIGSPASKFYVAVAKRGEPILAERAKGIETAVETALHLLLRQIG